MKLGKTIDLYNLERRILTLTSPRDREWRYCTTSSEKIRNWLIRRSHCNGDRDDVWRHNRSAPGWKTWNSSTTRIIYFWGSALAYKISFIWLPGFFKVKSSPRPPPHWQMGSAPQSKQSIYIIKCLYIYFEVAKIWCRLPQSWMWVHKSPTTLLKISSSGDFFNSIFRFFIPACEVPWLFQNNRE